MKATETRTPTATTNGNQGGARALAVEVKKASHGMSRVERWHKLAEERIEQLRGCDVPWVALLQECAEIEGVTPAALIVERLARERLGGAVVEERPADYFCPEFKAYEDTLHERAATRTRNAHECSIVSDMVHRFTSAVCLTADLVKRHGRLFVRHFYHKGDAGLYAANKRMMADALERIGGKEARA